MPRNQLKRGRQNVCQYVRSPHKCIQPISFMSEGGYNRVYTATNICHQPKDKAPGEAFLIRRVMKRKHARPFLKGIYKTVHLRHPNIVQTCTIYPEGTNLIIIQELIPGYNFEDWVDRQPRHRLLHHPHLVAMILYQYAKALDYLHRQHLIHRDIKTDNTIYDPQTGHLTIIDCDFITKAPASGRYGTLSFLAPEMELGHLLRKQDRTKHNKTNKVNKVNKATYGTPVDMWSLGMVLYELLQGVNSSPIHSHRYLQDVLRGKKHPLQSFHQQQHVQPPLYDILKRLLDVRPHKRMTARQLLHHPWIQKNLRIHK